MMWRPSHRGNWFFLILFSEYSLVYCNWTFDSILCWPPTVAGHATELKCPDQKVFDPTSKTKRADFHNRIWMDFFLSLQILDISSHVSTHDTSEYAVRKCSTEGFWEGKPGVLSTSTVGWTNYSGCYFPEFKKLLDQLGEEREVRLRARSDFFFSNFTSKFSFCQHFQLKLQIAERTRILEFLGLSVSLISLIISLVIFYRFRWDFLFASHFSAFVEICSYKTFFSNWLQNFEKQSHKNPPKLVHCDGDSSLLQANSVYWSGNWCAFQRFSSWLTLMIIWHRQGNHTKETQRGIILKINCWNKHQQYGELEVKIHFNLFIEKNRHEDDKSRREEIRRFFVDIKSTFVFK